jgi:putative ABC transport system permease protein
MKALLGAAGVDIPSTGISLLPRTTIVTLVVGLLVTVLSAVVPARKAGRVPPVAAMRDTAVEATEFSHRRLVAGLVIAAISVALVVLGLSGPVLALIPGILLVFIALFVLGPLVARRFSLMIGTPIAAVKGVTGQMARENAARNPKRTASTAAALLIGVTLVSGVAVVAASLKSSVRDIFEKQIVGDVVVNADDQSGMAGFSTTLADQVGELPGVQAAAGISYNYVTIDGDTKGVSVVNPSVAGRVFDLKLTEGSFDAVDANGIAISTDYADQQDLTLGDTVDVTLLNGTARTLTVQAIYDEDILAGARVVNRELFADSGQPILDFAIYVLRDEGTSATTIKSEISDLIATYGFGKVQTRAEYIDDQARQFTQFVNLVYGLLGLSVFIAAFGILLTMLLSVFERRRELALSRAVGMSKRQVRSMVRWEAVITSLLGAIQGVIVGSLLGFACYWALRGQGFKKFAYPVGTVIVVAVLAALIGVLAAVIPARRATKVNVVEAIATT